MKKYVGTFLVVLLIPLLLGCEKTEDLKIQEKESNYTQKYNYITVDISDGGGHYALMADTELEYYNEALMSICIENPTLLAFQLPEKFSEGAGIVDIKYVKELTGKIKSHLDSNEVDSDTERLLSEILQGINDITVITSAST